MPNTEEWGKGYDFGQIGMMKAIKSAEEIATAKAEDRIIKLLEEQYEQGHWEVGIIPNLIVLIKGENK